MIEIKKIAAASLSAIILAGQASAMEAPNESDSTEEPANNAPPECPGFLTYDELYYIGQNGHIILSKRKFIADDQPMIAGMLANWYLPHVSYAFVTGGVKKDDPSGYQLTCNYNYRTVAQRAMGQDWTPFSIKYTLETGMKKPSVSEKEYNDALNFLGVNAQPSNAQVRKAAVGGAHHPDKGGDLETFKMRVAAYDTVRLYREQHK